MSTEFNTKSYARKVHFDARQRQYRSGQYLFNTLPVGAADAVRGKLFDPFYKDMSLEQLVEWVENHLVLGRTVGWVMAVL